MKDCLLVETCPVEKGHLDLVTHTDSVLNSSSLAIGFKQTQSHKFIVLLGATTMYVNTHTCVCASTQLQLMCVNDVC